MAVAVLRKPDAGGVRIDVIFRDRDDAALVWTGRNRDSGVLQVETRCDGRRRLSVDGEQFLREAAVLAADKYLHGDPLDAPPQAS